MNRYLSRTLGAVLLCAAGACGPSAPAEPRLADLPKRADLWVTSVALSPDSQVRHVGESKDLLLTTVSSTQELQGVHSVSVGDVVNGIPIGAIRASFHWKDAGKGASQYMWRGRWACMAGRSRYELENAVNEDGSKRFEYIYIAPVTM